MASERNRLIALVLCLLVGYLGIHRFYVGKWITGIIWLLTGGVAGLGVIFDFVMIVIGAFRDSEGNPVSNW